MRRRPGTPSGSGSLFRSRIVDNDAGPSLFEERGWWDINSSHSARAAPAPPVAPQAAPPSHSGDPYTATRPHASSGTPLSAVLAFHRQKQIEAGDAKLEAKAVASQAALAHTALVNGWSKGSKGKGKGKGKGSKGGAESQAYSPVGQKGGVAAAAARPKTARGVPGGAAGAGVGAAIAPAATRVARPVPFDPANVGIHAAPAAVPVAPRGDGGVASATPPDLVFNTAGAAPVRVALGTMGAVPTTPAASFIPPPHGRNIPGPGQPPAGATMGAAGADSQGSDATCISADSGGPAVGAPAPAARTAERRLFPGAPAEPQRLPSFVDVVGSVVPAVPPPPGTQAPRRCVALCMYAPGPPPGDTVWCSARGVAGMLATFGQFLTPSDVWIAAAASHDLRSAPERLGDAATLDAFTRLLECESVEKVCYNAQQILAVPARHRAKLGQCSALASGLAPVHVHDVRTMLWMLAAGAQDTPNTVDEALALGRISLTTPAYQVPVGFYDTAVAAAVPVDMPAVQDPDLPLEKRKNARQTTSPTTRAGRSPRCRIAHAVELPAHLPELLDLHRELKGQLDQQRLAACYIKLEMPVTWVLTCMHVDGFDIDVQGLHESTDEIRTRLATWEAEAKRLTDNPSFNILSGDDIRAFLFDELELHKKVDPGSLQTTKKKGVYSTDQQTLQALTPLHPLPGVVLQYRAVAKVFSTYIQNLSSHARRCDSGVPRVAVHPVFNQEGTETGRLSCANPNLQNQPRSSGAGDAESYAGAVRRAFTPRGGEILIALDYSQIEVRVLAHMSQDPELTRILTDGVDLHSAIAARVFNKPQGAVTPAERQVGKKVVFGTLYGQGPRALAASLGIDFNSACAFLGQFKRAFPTVASWSERVLRACRTSGGVRTFANRLRALPNINSKNPAERSQAERQAVNTVIQGTAADVIKMAMIACAPHVRAFNLSLTCQIHDEIIFSAPAVSVADAIPVLKHAMENAILLSVPLVVTVETGTSWGCMQPWAPDAN